MKLHGLSIKYVLLLITIFACFLVYFGAGEFNFVNYDDDENIQTNQRFTEYNIENLSFHYDHNRYKSLAVWSFMGEYQMFGGEAKSYHLVNLFLHLINILLLFVFCRKIVPKHTFTPFIVAALFALHPAFVEPVVWITGRKDLLFVFFSLMALILYLDFNNIENSKPSKKLFLFIGVTVCIYLASMSKIQAVTIPLLLLLIDWVFHRKIDLNTILEKLILLLLVFDFFFFAFIFIMLIVLIKHRIRLLNIFTKNTVRKIITLLLLASIFVVVQIVGKNYNKNHPSEIISLFSNSKIYWLIFLMMSLFIVFANMLGRIKFFGDFKFSKTLLVSMFLLLILSFSIALFFGNYYNNFWNLRAGDENYFVLGERFLLMAGSLIFYVKRFLLVQSQNPMIPYPAHDANGALPEYLWTNLIFAIILIGFTAFILFRYFRKNRLVWFGVLFFLINIGLVLHIIPIEGRVMVADRYTYLSYIGLFLLVGLAADYFIARKRGAIVGGVLGLAFLMMAFTSYRDKMHWKNSFTLWQKALAENPENHYAKYSLALAYFAEGNDPVMAEQYLNQAIEAKEDFMYYNNRGRVRYAQGNFRGALTDFDKSISIDSASFAALNNRGAVRQQFCDFSGALSDYNHAIQLQPDYQEAINNKVKVLNLMHLDSVVAGQLTDTRVSPEALTDFVVNKSEKLLNTMQRQEAILFLTKALETLPKQAMIYEKLAVIYHMNNEFDEAGEIYNLGLKEIPENPSLLLGRGLLFIQKGDTISACRDLKNSAAQGDPDAQNLVQQFCN